MPALVSSPALTETSGVVLSILAFLSAGATAGDTAFYKSKQTNVLVFTDPCRITMQL